METPSPCHQWKPYPCISLEGCLIIRFARSDGEPEISVSGESTLEILVDPYPMSPILQSLVFELRQKFRELNDELSKDRRCDR